jgi:predicted HicB family RNase H-like nuclease
MPSQHKRAPLTVRVPAGVEDAVRARAAEQGITLGQAVTEALRAWLAAAVASGKG